VCSILTYGSEAWMLTDALQSRIRNWNARCLHHISGRNHRDETKEPSFDVLGAIRATRLRWLGHILRLPGVRLIKQWVVQEWEENRKTAGSIFMDAPAHDSIEELAQHAFDRQAWRARVAALKRS